MARKRTYTLRLSDDEMGLLVTVLAYYSEQPEIYETVEEGQRGYSEEAQRADRLRAKIRARWEAA